MTKDAVKGQEKSKTRRLDLPRDGYRILIVDDERSIRDLFLMVISCGLPDCSIDVAVNGAEAVVAFRQARPSVLVMDLKMPVMDGGQAFEEIEKLCKTQSWTMPSVIFCTGFAPPDRIQNLIKDNPIHCLLRKPVSPKQLMEAIRKRLPGAGSSGEDVLSL